MEKDYSLFLDFYLLTMSQVYFNSGKKDTVAVFDAFFRKEPLNAGYGVMAGVDKIIEHVKNLKFSDSDIEYLKSLNKFSEDFLEYLKNFKFTGDISAIPDGTPVFGNEPILTVKAPIIEAQILETALLSYLNSNICWATATKKVTEAAKEIEVMEFGGRRGMGPQAAIDASKCAVMAGAIGTSNTIAGKEHGIKSLGTMAHSLVEFFPTEYDSFMDYAKTFPNDSIFLVDTFNTLKSGVPNAINVAQDYLMPNGHRLKGIRIDSGDLAYLSKKAREMLDEVDLKDAKICISNGLDDKTIESLRNQGAPIDIIGLGDNIVLPEKARVGVVYKLVALQRGNEYEAKIKVSDESAKVLNPGYKKVYRFYKKDTGEALGDVIALHDEVIPLDEFTLVDPLDTTKTQTINNYRVRELQVSIFRNGELVYEDPALEEKKAYCNAEMKTLYPEVKRTENPAKYYVDLTDKLLELKTKLIAAARKTEVVYGGRVKK